MSDTLRVLLLSDTHIGFDLPVHPRVERRRRGPDFIARFEEALEPALWGRADLVVHAGDLLYRARVPASLVQCAMAPLLRVADQGVPVFLVPGNHERSRIPYPLLTRHRNVFVFDEPRTFTGTWGGVHCALAGFPFVRNVDGSAFPELLAATRWSECRADVRLLCMHQAVEGATVGVQAYTFRSGNDVVPGRSIPSGFAAVLCGHIHRHQVLTRDLRGRRLAAPVLYPGSVERTAFAERDEPKGCLHLRVRGSAAGGELADWSFRRLAARPMHVLQVEAQGRTAADLEREVRQGLRALEADAVVCVAPRADVGPELAGVLSAPNLRRLAPAQMNVTLARPRRGDREGRPARATR